MAVHPQFDAEQACAWWKTRIAAQWPTKAAEINTAKNDEFVIQVAPEKIYLGDRLIEQYLRPGQAVVIIDYEMPTTLDANETGYEMETYQIIVSVVVG